MERYFFHLWDGEQLIPDGEGVELDDLPAARDRALGAARALLAEEVLSGRLPLFMRLDVEDGARTIVHQLPFGDAVRILQ